MLTLGFLTILNKRYLLGLQPNFSTKPIQKACTRSVTSHIGQRTWKLKKNRWTCKNKSNCHIQNTFVVINQRILCKSFAWSTGTAPAFTTGISRFENRISRNSILCSNQCELARKQIYPGSIDWTFNLGINWILAEQVVYEKSENVARHYNCVYTIDLLTYHAFSRRFRNHRNRTFGKGAWNKWKVKK